MKTTVWKKAGMLVMLGIFGVLLSLFTVFFQFRELGLAYLEEGYQIQRHIAVLQGTSPDPWQYRVLSEYLVEGVFHLFTSLDVPRPIATGFITFRIVQNTVLFLLAFFYYKKIGIRTYTALIGLSLLAWGMTYANYGSDLQFNTYFDVIFYLLAALSILYEEYVWIVPLTGFAALNRETSGLIPFMLLGEYLLRGRENNSSRKMAIFSICALLLYVCIFFSLRKILGPRPLFIPFGNPPGIKLFKYNMFRYITWVQLFATLGILPGMALYSIHKWPRTLRMFFWVIVPIWVVIHIFCSIISETRLFLVPHTLVFIPGALLGISNYNKK